MSTTIRLELSGLHCVNCAKGVENYLNKQGLANAQVSFANNEAVFDLPEKTELPKIIKGIESLGFNVLQGQQVEKKYLFGWSKLHWLFTISAIFTLPLLLAMFMPAGNILHQNKVQFILCLPVYAISLYYFGLSAVRSLKTGVPNMDVLIIIGTTAAFIYSLVGFINGYGHDFQFWETSASITTLVLLGNLLEQRSVYQTNAAIRGLIAMQPEKANLISFDQTLGKETIISVPAKDVKTKQILLVNSGDKIPVDGVVIWGEGMVNSSMMTGESELQYVATKNEVIGGTVLESGSIRIEATRVGGHTALSKIIELVRKAQNDQPKIHRLADKISAVFVPAVLAVAILTFVLGFFAFNLPAPQAMLNAIAVLVIACPCAMGLATPTAVMVGLGRATRQGILIKGGSIIELLANVKKIVFDKTGTLTTGALAVGNYSTTLPDDDFAAAVSGLEKYSSHPIAKSVVNFFETYLSPNMPPLVFSQINETKGKGITGTDSEGNIWAIGAQHYFDDDLVQNSKIVEGQQIYISCNNKFVGSINLTDTPCPEAAQVITQLKSLEIEPLLLSGDQQTKVAQFAQTVGIDNWMAGQLPQQKLAVIDNLQQENTAIAMVGDGVNDAPALQKATIGISLSDASSLAMETADIVLLNNKLGQLTQAIGISKLTITTIKQNLFWAFFYNVLAIPLAAAGYLNPTIAALTMALSDVVVIGNSLRLRYKKLPF